MLVKNIIKVKDLVLLIGEKVNWIADGILRAGETTRR